MSGIIPLMAGNYGELIDRLRKKRGLEVSQLAQMAGTEKQTVYQIIQGRTRRPRLATLQALAKALDVEWSDFLTLASDLPANIPEAKTEKPSRDRVDAARYRVRRIEDLMYELSEQGQELAVGAVEGSLAVERRHAPPDSFRRPRGVAERASLGAVIEFESAIAPDIEQLGLFPGAELAPV